MSLSRIAVVGAGPKGLSIAEALAGADLPVTVVCMATARAELARARLRKTLAMRVSIGELTEERAQAMLGAIRVTQNLADVAECDLVIESAVGDLRMRRAVLATVEGRISRGAVLASDVAGRDLESMAEVLTRRDQFVGMRFFHPATHTPLVEIATLPDSAPGAALACETLSRWLGKTPVQALANPTATPTTAAATG